MMKKIFLFLLLVIGGILGFASTRPDDFRVQRQAEMKATPDKVFAQVHDFQQWPAWSPWEKLDPAMKKAISNPSMGKGATYAWEGNDQVGQGKMTILEETAPSAVKMELHFIKPFEDTSVSEWSFQPKGEATEVTWAMLGKHNIMTKVIGLFCDMDQMIGKDFDTGLANIKSIVEKSP